MQIDNLIRMANRIGAFFDAMPDRPQAEADIAQHIERFWAPRMRQQLQAHVRTQAGEGIAPLVLAALRQWPGADHAVAAAED